MHFKFSLFLFFAVINFAYSQHRISGRVKDKDTGEPLAFASVIFNNNPRFGTTTNIDGKFAYSGAEAIHTIKCSYVGYSEEVLQISGNRQDIVIELTFAENVLEEVVVNQGENPANAIMRKVIANKEINNPENIESFKYKSYNKVIYDFKAKDKNDSIKLKQRLQNGHIFMMESVTERKFISPDNSEEVVLATRVSGFKNPSFASLATDLQPFSFYKDNIPFINVNYLNPVSKGSLNKYKFTLQDTLYQGRDTVYVISYKPLPRKNFDGLTGLLYINTNKYALQNVSATPFEKGKIDIKIQQQYSLVDGQWFPQQLEYALIMNDYPTKKTGMIVQGRSYIDNVQLNVPLRKKDFRLESVWIDDDAAKKDSIYWQTARREALNTEEATTYRVIDSLGEKHNFDGMLTVVEKLVRGRIPVKFVDIDLGKTLVYNKYEGFRLGLGLYTNEKLFDRLELGGFFGYGLKDEKWKYGGEINYELSKRHEFKIGAKYQDNLVEVGEHGFKHASFSYYNFRDIIAYRMDRIQEETFNVGFRAMRYFKWNLNLSHQRVNPLYPYAFINDGTTFTRYDNSTVGVSLRFAYKEKIVNSFRQNISTGTTWPVLYLYYTRGIKDMFEGDFNYNKIEAVIEDSFYTKSFGKTTYRVEAGYIDKPVPYGQLFTGEGSYDDDTKIIVKNTFQTLLPYEFLSDRYVNLFTSHNFESLLFKTAWFQPQLSVHNNFGYGDLRNPYSHLTDFKVKDKLFMETGLQVDQIVKMNYLNIGYLGFGAGVFCRYGGYAYDDFNDNLVFKITASFSIK
ncbi:DUF5686 and carboxypeptidase regulatory-like domain-containing protein [Flavobacterium sp. MFBS3-15]|uniref:DUF5686 and carboxypeptidase-like regulatory domain-containing protein n=1 Tax=Flavobacterium sp. MFBS3-15 TaxID=2989816 RepID=UPI0022357EDD|nr:DUF5686 and carboxypeptidase-like regulatory domain-containing protein [Flavobacterium sp. MFBS3-15]MCW4469537.1 DUF5686 and carboxypeptidase regulatory-like domain-containing protein [Flavobacterium sp. MFBS3-15]